MDMKVTQKKLHKENKNNNNMRIKKCVIYEHERKAEKIK
jgi:hypothetical protein